MRSLSGYWVVSSDAKHSVQGVTVSMSEAEAHWRDFLLSLKKRGMHGVKLISSDDRSGLRAALQSSMRAWPGNGAKCIFNAPDREEADRLLAKTIEKYSKKASRLAL
ncbi:MAG: transposase [Pontiella sp.]